jgi:hypothetical protein
MRTSVLTAALGCWVGLASGCTPHAPAAETLVGAADEEATELACRGRPRRQATGNLEDAIRAGERDAALDVAREVFVVEAYDLPWGCRAGFSAGLMDRHGIHLRELGRCTIDDEVVGHARGYNATMRPYLEQRHGAGVVEALARASGCLRAPDGSGPS